MKRLRDYYLVKAIEAAVGRKLEYILDNDLEQINYIIIKNPEKGNLVTFKDINDFEVFKKFDDKLYIEFIGFNMTNLHLEFINSVDTIIFRECQIDGLNITVKNYDNGFKLILDKVINKKEIAVNEQFSQCRKLEIIGKPTTELNRKYTIQEITVNMKKIIPEYMDLPTNKQIGLLQKHGYLSVYPQKVNITGIEKLELLKAISLQYMEIDAIRFSEITKYTKDTRVLDEIKFINCKFNEAPILYKQPVKRLVINNCEVNRKELLPNFVQVNAIEVIDTKGMEIPKLNEPKILKGLKFVNSEVNLTNISNVKELEYLIILDQKLSDINFAKTLKKLKFLVVNKGFVEDISILKKLKKLKFIEIENDDLTAEYNKLFI